MDQPCQEVARLGQCEKHRPVMRGTLFGHPSFVLYATNELTHRGAGHTKHAGTLRNGAAGISLKIEHGSGLGRGDPKVRQLPSIRVQPLQADSPRSGSRYSSCAEQSDKTHVSMLPYHLTAA